MIGDIEMDRDEELGPTAISRHLIQEAEYVSKTEANAAIRMIKNNANESLLLLKAESDKAYSVQAELAIKALSALSAEANLAMNLLHEEADEAEVLVKTEAEEIKPDLTEDAIKAEIILKASDNNKNANQKETAKELIETAREAALILPTKAEVKSRSLINIAAQRAEILLLNGAKEASALLEKAREAADILPKNAEIKSKLLIDDASTKANVFLHNAASRVGIILNEESQNLVSRKINFLDIAAHELRNPITSISLLLEVMEQKTEMGLPLDISVLKKLRPPIDRLSRLIVDLLDMSRLERGKFTLQPVKTDITTVILESIEDSKTQSTNRNFIFNRPDQPVELEIDPLRIRQVLTNLIDNAVKYAPEGDIEITIKEMQNIVQVSVIDHGPGISKKIQKSLFKAFFRGESKKTIYASGLGLGLSICRSILDLHGGTIGVESEIGIGSTFHFEFHK